VPDSLENNIDVKLALDLVFEICYLLHALPIAVDSKSTQPIIEWKFNVGQKIERLFAISFAVLVQAEIGFRNSHFIAETAVVSKEERNKGHNQTEQPTNIGKKTINLPIATRYRQTFSGFVDIKGD